MEQRRKNAAIGLVLIAIICFWVFVKPQLEMLQKGYKAYRLSATDTFLDYGKELESLQTKLDVLMSEDTNTPKEDYYIEEKIAYYFMRDNYKTAYIINQVDYYQHVAIYRSLNDVLSEITSDGVLSESETNFLKALSSYNKALIGVHKELSGPMQHVENVGMKTINAFQNKIFHTYADFSAQAQTLLERPEFKVLDGYEGDFSNADFNHAQTVCKALFAKVAKDQSLNFDNRDEINKRSFIFKTDEDKWNPIDGSGMMTDKIGYSVEYDKRTKMVNLSATRFSVPQTYKQEVELDRLADHQAITLDASAVFQSKNVRHDKDTAQIMSIEYCYHVENLGTTEDAKQLKITVERSGIISHVVLWDSSL